METLLVIGVLASAVLGVLHAVAVRRRLSALPGAGAGRATYAALWTLVLWLLFGSYVLVLWLIGATGLGITRLARAARGDR